MSSTRALCIALVVVWTAGCGKSDQGAPAGADSTAATAERPSTFKEEEADKDQGAAAASPGFARGPAAARDEATNGLVGATGQGSGGLATIDLISAEGGEAMAPPAKPMEPPEETEINQPVLIDSEGKEVGHLESAGKKRSADRRSSAPEGTDATGVDDVSTKTGEDFGDDDGRFAGDAEAERSQDGERERRVAANIVEGHERFVLRGLLDEKKDEAEKGGDRLMAVARNKKSEDVIALLDPSPERRPERFLPRFLYFENTYLGGDAAYRENLRRINEALGAERRPHDLAHAYPQPFDAPPEAGLSLTAELDRWTFEKPGRVFLQVGIQGSRRYGWRRPPLEVVLVLDTPALAAGMEPAIRVIGELLTQLGPQDQLAVVLVGAESRTLAPLGRIRALRTALPPVLDDLGAQAGTGANALASAMRRSGVLLQQASNDRTTLPGTQTVLVLTSGSATDGVGPATDVAHALTMQGIVTSVIEVDAAPRGEWWAVANAGYGNYHRIEGGDPKTAVKDELDTLSRVVARLVRVNIRLSKNAEGIRILGSRVLDQEEVRRVKAREVAADRNLSKTMGVKADRGDDDDGIQTVIPYFYGGDAHVILVELWVDRPGAVADVTLRYKDMVNLSNATAQVSVAIRNVPREDTPEQLAIRRNLRGMSIADSLERASIRVRHGDPDGALQWLASARIKAVRTTVADREVVARFARLVDDRSWTGDPRGRDLLAESLYLAGRRKVGEPAP